MKITENNGSLKKVVALLLVTCIVIGLVSSTAIKLVSATYYMQTKRKLVTNNPTINKVIGIITGDEELISGDVTPAPETTAPPTTEAPTEAPTQAPETTAPETSAPEASEPASDSTTATTAGDSGSSGGSTDILGTITDLFSGINIGGIIDGVGGLLNGGSTGDETTTTTEPTTESAESIKQKKSVLSEYNTVVNYAKKVGKPAFTKVTYRTFDREFGNILLHSFESAYPDYFISKENAEAAPIVVPANTATSELLIDNENYAGMLATADASAAIESATSVKLEDGSQKIVITLREEANPAVTASDAKKAASYTSAMFPVVTSEKIAEMVNSTLNITSLTSSSVTYKNCTVELIYNPVLNRIISVKQTTSYVAAVKGQSFPSKGTVTEVSEYKDFDYGLM